MARNINPAIGGIGSVVKSVERSVVSSSLDTIDVTISTIDASKSYVFYTRTSSASNDANDTEFTAEIVNDTTIRFIRDASGTGTNELQWTVVEFLNIKSIQFFLTDLTNLTTIAQVVNQVDTSNSMFVFAQKTGLTAIAGPDIGIKFDFNSSTNVQLTAAATHGAVPRFISWFLIEYN